MQTNLLESSTEQHELISQLNPKQDEFIFAEDEFVCIKGTWGCGKSIAALLAVDRECLEHPGALVIVTRKEWPDLRDSTMRDWNKFIGRPIVSNNVNYPNGSVVMMRHGNDLNSLKNTTASMALMVQAEEESEETFWFLKGRLRNQIGSRQLRLECNYNGHNWIYDLFNKQKLGKLITTNTFDNKQHLPEGYITGLMKLPKRLRDRHLYGTDDDMEGRCYDEYTQSRHFIDPFEIPETWEKGFVLDHGYTNPTAAIAYAVDHDGKIYIYHEHYEKEKPVSYHAEQIKKQFNMTGGMCDPSLFARTQHKGNYVFTIADEYRDYGINLVPAYNSNEDASIARVNEYFKSDKLFIFKNCVKADWEVSNWKWKPLKAGSLQNPKEEPQDLNNHICDDIKYLVASRVAGQPIDNKPKIEMYSPAYYIEEHKRKLREGIRADRGTYANTAST